MAIEANSNKAPHVNSQSQKKNSNNFNSSSDLTFSIVITCPECLSHEASLIVWFLQVSCSSISLCLFHCVYFRDSVLTTPRSAPENNSK